MIITPITVGPFEENCYLIADEASREAVLLDPGDEGERIVRQIERAGVHLNAIWLTHAHLDHIGGIAAVRRTWRDLPIHLHPLDQPLYAAGAMQAAHYGLPFEEPPPSDRSLADGDVLEVGSLRFTVLHVPGHAPGHVAFHGHGVVFVGDCLFAGSIGRTDLPLASSSVLTRSLERLCALPSDTTVYPGHGSATTIGAEVATNPFLTGVARLPSR
ncbi:MAG: MBL fold metallo-hydrolase [Gemmatimonadales bacterium]|jgi:glyoxylase-like metal-dependent hydrolase (beta-lactamase superfamily II)